MMQQQQIVVKEGFDSTGKLFITNETFGIIKPPYRNYATDTDSNVLQWAATVHARGTRHNKKRMRIFFKHPGQYQVSGMIHVPANVDNGNQDSGDETFTYLQPVMESDDAIEFRISRMFNALRKLTRTVATGHVRALSASGSAGTGKTHCVLSTLERLGKKVNLLKGTISAVMLFTELWNSRENGDVVVMDDCDVLGDIDAANMLKAAMDTTKKRIISYAKLSSYLEENDIPNSFEFNGGIIYLSNVDFEREVARSTKMSVHYEAFLSRALFIPIRLDSMRERLVWVKSVVYSEEFRETHGVSDDIVIYIHDWMNKNAERLRELSIRTAVKMVGLMKAAPDDWEELVEVTLCKI